jgi:hypothetical protein
MADLQCSPRGSLAPLKYLFDITCDCDLTHSSKQKELGQFFPARVDKIGANGAVAILRYPPDALAHSPQIEHSGAAEKWGK